jgi:hypothetical protein
MARIQPRPRLTNRWEIVISSARRQVSLTLRDPRRRLVAAMVAIALAGIMIPVGLSYGQALTGPGNDSLAIRSTEWLKDHHLAWAVNDVERWWYTHHPPKKGGVPTGALGNILPTSPAPSPTPVSPLVPSPTLPPASAPAPPVSAPGLLSHRPAPPSIPSIAANPLPGEGQWRSLGETVDGVPAMYAAFLRPDPVHTSLVTAVAWIDPTLVRFTGYAGVLEPGGGPWTNQAPIPVQLRPQLLAAFNSGFKMRDARGGYYADGRTAWPLVPGAATLVIDPNGVPNIGVWGRDVAMNPTIAFARQNLELIVDGGQPAADLNTNSRVWGASLGNAVYVWRSGLGITADGAMLYAAGDGLSAATLADVLIRAGAVRAMELDINSAWVDFFSYAHQPDGSITVNKLLPDMHPSITNYLTASSRDFIALFSRA